MQIILASNTSAKHKNVEKKRKQPFFCILNKVTWERKMALKIFHAEMVFGIDCEVQFMFLKGIYQTSDYIWRMYILYNVLKKKHKKNQVLIFIHTPCLPDLIPPKKGETNAAVVIIKSQLKPFSATPDLKNLDTRSS